MKRKLIEMGARWLLGGVFREIAEGKKGPKLRAIYWKVAGQKTRIAAVLGLLFAGLAAFDPALATRIAPTAALVIGLGVTVGLVDAGWRSAKPPAEWAEAFSKLMSAGPALAGVVALAVEYLPQIPGCEWCDPLALKLQLASAAVAAATAWLAARFALPPAPPTALDALGSVSASSPARR
jgi:hypothetical protein